MQINILTPIIYINSKDIRYGNHNCLKGGFEHEDALYGLEKSGALRFRHGTALGPLRLRQRKRSGHRIQNQKRPRRHEGVLSSPRQRRDWEVVDHQFGTTSEDFSYNPEGENLDAISPITKIPRRKRVSRKWKSQAILRPCVSTMKLSETKW